MQCPFCNKEVENSRESVLGCVACVQEWVDNSDVDHDIS